MATATSASSKCSTSKVNTKTQEKGREFLCLFYFLCYPTHLQDKPDLNRLFVFGQKYTIDFVVVFSGEIQEFFLPQSQQKHLLIPNPQGH